MANYWEMTMLGQDYVHDLADKVRRLDRDASQKGQVCMLHNKRALERAQKICRTRGVGFVILQYNR